MSRGVCWEEQTCETLWVDLGALGAGTGVGSAGLLGQRRGCGPLPEGGSSYYHS